jgi:EAL domain-containing protein (putative c-di-GMP-specific phosphodiesterase class I)
VYSGQSATGLLAEADMALREAQREGPNAWVVQRRPAATGDVRSASDWRRLIGQAIDQDRFVLLQQPVMRCSDGGLHHHEVFLRIVDPGQPGGQIPAAAFLPAAHSAGLAATIDKAVAGRVIAALQDGSYPGRVAMNLALASLADDDLLAWFADHLRRVGDAAARLILELPEYGVAANVDRLNAWIERLQPFGVGFSLDHFGKGFSSFTHLRAIKVHYLKIDGSFVRKLEQHDDNRFLLRTIADIAHGLDMEVIAESVETEAAWQAVRGLGLDAGRGFWLGQPE